MSDSGQQHHAHPGRGHRRRGRGGCPDGRECRCAENGPRIHGFLIPCILLQLDRGPSHGYRLKESLVQTEYMSQLSDPGVLYRHLRQLESHGLVTSALEQGEGPARKVYSITPEGRECLKGWAAGLAELQKSVTAILSDMES